MLEFAHQEHIKSYYFDSRNQAFELPPLTQQEEADVCVIGAGFFGLSAALELGGNVEVCSKRMTLLTMLH